MGLSSSLDTVTQVRRSSQAHRVIFGSRRRAAGAARPQQVPHHIVLGVLRLGDDHAAQQALDLQACSGRAVLKGKNHTSWWLEVTCYMRGSSNAVEQHIESRLSSAKCGFAFDFALALGLTMSYFEAPEGGTAASTVRTGLYLAS